MKNRVKIGLVEIIYKCIVIRITCDSTEVKLFLYSISRVLCIGLIGVSKLS